MQPYDYNALSSRFGYRIVTPATELLELVSYKTTFGWPSWQSLQNVSYKMFFLLSPLGSVHLKQTNDYWSDFEKLSAKQKNADRLKEFDLLRTPSRPLNQRTSKEWIFEVSSWSLISLLISSNLIQVDNIKLILSADSSWSHIPASTSRILKRVSKGTLTGRQFNKMTNVILRTNYELCKRNGSDLVVWYRVWYRVWCTLWFRLLIKLYRVDDCLLNGVYENSFRASVAFY